MPARRRADDPAGRADDPAGRAKDSSAPSAGASTTEPGEVRIAAAVVALQAAGLLVVMIVLLVKTIFGNPDDVARALLAAGMALAGALLLLAAARSLLAGRAGLRTLLIVVELLALPVGYSLGIQAGRVAYGAPILLSALAVLYLLFTPAARRALERGR